MHPNLADDRLIINAVANAPQNEMCYMLLTSDCTLALWYSN